MAKKKLTLQEAVNWFYNGMPDDRRVELVKSLVAYTFVKADEESTKEEIAKAHEAPGRIIYSILNKIDDKMESYSDFIAFASYLAVELSYLSTDAGIMETLGSLNFTEDDDVEFTDDDDDEWNLGID